MCQNIRCDVFFAFTGFTGKDLNRAVIKDEGCSYWICESGFIRSQRNCHIRLKKYIIFQTFCGSMRISHATCCWVLKSGTCRWASAAERTGANFKLCCAKRCTRLECPQQWHMVSPCSVLAWWWPQHVAHGVHTTVHAKREEASC